MKINLNTYNYPITSEYIQSDSINKKYLRETRKYVEELPLIISSISFDTKPNHIFRLDLLSKKSGTVNFVDSNGNTHNLLGSELAVYLDTLKISLAERYTKAFNTYETIRDNLSTYNCEQSILSTFYHSIST
tara:strand:+ start:184 stop:579 length:396 start_codon:yes stop_codon:yes gene_type:complete